MPRRKLSRRTPLQARADRDSEELAAKLGRMLLDGRRRGRQLQADAADRAGLSRPRWSDLEGTHGASAPLATWSRAAAAVGGKLDAWIKETSAADQPRDAVHLRNQELVLRISRPGLWQSLPEERLDRDVGRSRSADVLLHRHRPGAAAEYCLCEIWDWIDDVGGAVRDFGRRLPALDRYAVARMHDDDPVPITSGFWLVRATRRNRQLIGDHRNFFRTRFPGSGRAWLAALTEPDAPLPRESALLWASVRGERIFPAGLVDAPGRRS